MYGHFAVGIPFLLRSSITSLDVDVEEVVFPSQEKKMQVTLL